MSRVTSLPMALLCTGAVACGARDVEPTQQINAQLVNEKALDLIPRVEAIVGLEFKSEPGIEIRTRDQVRAYLIDRLNSQIPPEELDGITRAYRLFGLIPDTLDLRSFIVSLYTEQVAGYYDPDSTTLYVVSDSDPIELTLVLAHELVHALQDQYIPVDSLLSLSRENDRRIAAQAVLEGQATLVSIGVMLPEQDMSRVPEFWTQFRDMVRQQQEAMPVLASAPNVLKETMIFPYLAGADFVRWFMLEYPDSQPFGIAMPTSSEQILHPERYRSGDAPIRLRVESEENALYSNVLGEFEIRVLFQELAGDEDIARRAAAGWGGDRFAVFADGDADALVWWSVWDNEMSARRFRRTIESEWIARRGRRVEIIGAAVGGLPAVRVVDAADGWSGWDVLPGAERVQ